MCRLLFARSDPLVLLDFDAMSPNLDILLNGMTKNGVGMSIGRTSTALASSPEILCIRVLQLPL